MRNNDWPASCQLQLLPLLRSRLHPHTRASQRAGARLCDVVVVTSGIGGGGAHLRLDGAAADAESSQAGVVRDARPAGDAAAEG